MFAANGNRRPDRVPKVPNAYTVPALAKALVEAHGGHELANDSAIGIPRARDLQNQLLQLRR